MKDSFVFYTEYKEAIEFMADEQAGKLLKVLIRYTEDLEYDIEDPVVKMVFLTIKPRLDRDRLKWEKECERRAAAGRLGGLARASNAKQRQAELSKSKQNKANQADYDADADTDYDNNNNIGRKAQKFKKPTVEQVKEYCEERMNGIDPRSFVDFYEARGWKLTKGVAMKDWKAAVRNWERNGYRPSRKGANNKPPERTYDMNDLERKLRATN